MAKAKNITLNIYYLYGTLALALSTLTACIFWNAYFGYLFYILILAFVVLFIMGTISKKSRLNTKKADKILLASSLLLILANAFVLITQFLPSSNKYYLYYANFWQGWPVLPLAILLTIILLSSKRRVHKNYVYVAIALFVVGLIKR